MTTKISNFWKYSVFKFLIQAEIPTIVYNIKILNFKHLFDSYLKFKNVNLCLSKLTSLFNATTN